MTGQVYRIGFKPSRSAGRVEIFQTWRSVDISAAGKQLEVLLFYLREMAAPLAIRNTSRRAEILVRVVEDESGDPLILQPGDAALLELVDGRMVSVQLPGGAS